MSVAFSTDKSFFEDCFQYTEETSLRILKATTNFEELHHQSFDRKGDHHYDHWVCSIVVSLGEAKVFIESHFRSRTARKIAAKGLGIEQDSLNTSVLIDFMREYLNRVMGDIKARYQSDEVEVSVPQITPAYDQGIGSKDEGSNMNVRYWRICWSEGQLVFGCNIIQTGDVTAMSAIDDVEKSDEAEIEFL